MANGSPPLPGWLQPLATITTTIGVPTVFAGVLLYFVLIEVRGSMQKIQENEDERTKIVAAMQDTLVAALDKQADRFERAIQENIKANEKMADLAHQERMRFMEKIGERP